MPYQNFRILGQKHKNVQSIFIGLLFIIILSNIIMLYPKIKERLHLLAKPNVITFPGLKFSGLKDIFKDIDYAGYYTDKDQDEIMNSLQFSQAQYVLAPTILELNNIEHEYILFDCTTEGKALAKILSIRAVPIKKNQFGIILAKRIK